MGTVKENVEKEYNSFSESEKEAGKNLYNVYWKYYKQYCAAVIADWDKADVKNKIVFVRTAKAVRYAI